MQEFSSFNSWEDITHAAFDLDGTLLDRSGQLLPRMTEAFFRLRSRGTKLVLITGRPLIGLENEFIEKLRSFGFENYFFAGNGNVWLDISTGKKLTLLFLSSSMFQFLEYFGVRDVVAETEHAPLASTPKAAAAYAMAYRVPRSAIVIDPVVFRDSAPSLRVSALTVFGTDIRTLPKEALPRHELDFIGPFGAQIIRPPGTCKAAALETYLRCHGEGDSLRFVAAFGDAYNDACLLGASALGVAVRHADEVARRHSDVHLGTALDTYLLDSAPGSTGSSGQLGPTCCGGHMHPGSSRG